MFQMPWYSQLCIEDQHTFPLIPWDGTLIRQIATGQLWGIFHVIPTEAGIYTAAVGIHHALRLQGHAGGRTMELYGCVQALPRWLTDREVVLLYHLHDRGSCPHERPPGWETPTPERASDHCWGGGSAASPLVEVSCDGQGCHVSPQTLMHRSDQDTPDSTQAPDGTTLSYEEWDAKITALLAEYKVQEPKP